MPDNRRPRRGRFQQRSNAVNITLHTSNGQAWPGRKRRRVVRVFKMIRHGDESKVSGTGHVLTGVEWPNSWVTVMWLTDKQPSSVGIYPDFEAFLSIHVRSHPNNKTEIQWVDVDA
jgi:hypothetical protein